VVFYGLAIVYLLGVVVQFFLAGLALFSAGSYDTHRWVGYVLGVIAVVLLALAIGAKMPRSVTALTTVLVALNAAQIVLVQVDVHEIEALHVVNAVAIAFVANMLVHRSRRYIAARLADQP
jgi:hypothetical protein